MIQNDNKLYAMLSVLSICDSDYLQGVVLETLSSF